MEKARTVVKVVEKLGFIFGDGAKCQLGFYEPKKPEILKKEDKK
ncbi:cyclic lactone autoinducer peptide [Enterococcus durans]|nr:cyclic lactone autoinducer peptide [Enterococcus durans]MDT2835594.1 cyclic lactone autoinducer peptide [Enterococcus durans]